MATTYTFYEEDDPVLIAAMAGSDIYVKKDRAKFRAFQAPHDAIVRIASTGAKHIIPTGSWLVVHPIIDTAVYTNEEFLEQFELKATE